MIFRKSGTKSEALPPEGAQHCHCHHHKLRLALIHGGQDVGLEVFPSEGFTNMGKLILLF